MEKDTLMEEKDRLIKTLRERNSYLEAQHENDRMIAFNVVRSIMNIESELSAIRRNIMLSSLFRNRTGKVSSQIERDVDDDIIETKAVLLTEQERQIVKIFGEGASVLTNIRKSASATMPEAAAYRAIMHVREYGLVETVENVHSMGKRNIITIGKLTKTGEAIYKYIVGKDPVEPEMERLKRIHGTYGHGFAVWECLKKLNESGKYESVKTFDEEKTIEPNKHFPDILCIREDGTIEGYAIFENMGIPATSFYARISLLAKTAQDINIVVGNPNEHDKAQRLICAWCKPEKDKKEYKNRIIRLTNYNRLAESVKNKSSFDSWWYVTDKVKDFKPPLGYEGPLGN